jgi:hypothetical protein
MQARCTRPRIGRHLLDLGRPHYYIAADEVAWDYVPGGVDGIKYQPFTQLGFFKGGVPAGKPPISKPVSTKYMKALYREYTDQSFTTLKPRTPEWEHLGFLGPLVRAEVGDTIKIVFRNNGKKPYSCHPHGSSTTRTRKARRTGQHVGQGSPGRWRALLEVGTRTNTRVLVLERARRRR